ncbi:MAG: hypothetical protein LQ350_000048 [Teloschistes chrysophthalmus]|nr:MAG: hypothetical protein LQ350_000048 [Niorma chrysophthalma]
MPRAPAHEHEEPPRKSHRRYAAEEDLGYDDDEAAYGYDEAPAPPRRPKGGRKPAPEYVADEDDEDEEEEVYQKQTVVHKGKKKAKSSGKEVARRHKQESSGEEEEGEEEDSSDAEKKKKKKKKLKQKTKARKKEVVTKKAWEPCSFQEIDPPFLELMSRTLHVQGEKLDKYIIKGKVERHTETGEYNIDAILDGGYIPDKAKSQWKAKVKELKQDPKKAKILYCSLVTEGDGMMMAAAGPSRTRAYAPPVYGQRTLVAVGHRTFDPGCYDCQMDGIPCAYSPY